MQNSSDDLIDVTNAVGISGKFMELARSGQLMAVSKAIQDRVKIAKELAEVEGKLKACNDLARLAEFEKWYRKSKRTFESRLQKLVADLEDRKCRLLAELRQIDQRLNEEELGGSWTVDPAPMVSLVPRLVKKSSPFVAERNEVIDENLRFSSEEICKLLDHNFARNGDRCCDQLPKSWASEFQVDTFLAAYRHPECRNLVHRLISGRRGLSNYPKT